MISIEEKHGKNWIFNIHDFPHIKHICQNCVKNESFFSILQRKILHTEKVAFLGQEKICFFLFKTFSRGSMALKTCGKYALQNS